MKPSGKNFSCGSTCQGGDLLAQATVPTGKPDHTVRIFCGCNESHAFDVDLFDTLTQTPMRKPARQLLQEISGAVDTERTEKRTLRPEKTEGAPPMQPNGEQVYNHYPIQRLVPFRRMRRNGSVVWSKQQSLERIISRSSSDVFTWCGVKTLALRF